MQGWAVSRVTSAGRPLGVHAVREPGRLPVHPRPRHGEGRRALHRAAVEGDRPDRRLQLHARPEGEVARGEVAGRAHVEARQPDELAGLDAVAARQRSDSLRAWPSSTSSSSARGRWAAGSRRSSRRPGGASRCTTRRRARSSAASRRCAGASRSSPRRAAPIPDEVLARVEPVDDLVPADLLIEAVVEDARVKEEIFRRADAVLPPAAILASNTSSIPITSLAAATSRPDRVIGMHFFNPVPVLKLVEVIRGLETSDETAQAIVQLARRARKDACRGARLARLRLQPDPDAVHQRGRVRAARGRRRAGGDRHDREARLRASAWARSRSPT